MIPHFNVCVKAGNLVTITDLTKEADEYTPEDSNIDRNFNFKYSQTATINIIELITLDSTKIIDTVYTEHCVELDELHYEIPKDGYYRIYHIILPTLEWLELKEDVGAYSNVYIYDNESIYKFVGNDLIECSPVELLGSTENTTISRSTKDMFFTFDLTTCYINICKKLFGQKLLARCKNSDGDLVFKRDFLWMTLNVIRYYLKKDLLYEAEKILEEINYCNGFCSDQSYDISNSDCGCGG